MKVNLFVLLSAFILGFVSLLFQNEVWSKFISIPCGIYIVYSFIVLTISAINSFKRK